VPFEQSRDGSISIDESSEVRLLDFGNRLSHGVNQPRKAFYVGLLRFGLDYYLTVSREESS
jgi:hypothetical protein